MLHRLRERSRIRFMPSILNEPGTATEKAIVTGSRNTMEAPLCTASEVPEVVSAVCLPQCTRS